jgi:hypothetical protein
MSLLSSFITDHVIKALEAQFVAHEPEMAEAFVNEVSAAVNAVVNWVNEKVAAKQNAGG